MVAAPTRRPHTSREGPAIHPAEPDPVLITGGPRGRERSQAVEPPAGSLHIQGGPHDSERRVESPAHDGRAQQARAGGAGYTAGRGLSVCNERFEDVRHPARRTTPPT